MSAVAADDAIRSEVKSLRATLEHGFGFECTIPGSSLTSLRTADVAVFVRGPGALSDNSAAALREFLGSGKGIVILGAAIEAWPTEPGFEQNVIGATRTGTFAGGSPMTIINLFPHSIFTGVTRFATDEPAPVFSKLADDAQMIMEGTVGEATTPLAWVRRRSNGRIASFVFANSSGLNDATFQRMIGNAVLWTGGRPIPGAHAAVQRTLMPDAYPGAFAVTLPNGPGVCLDLVRGGINYVWDGDFVDLRPRWITKQGEPARIFGEIFYREKAWHPFRARSPNAEVDFQFRGYTLQAGVPEFHYTIGGREVHETLASAPGGGLMRRFRVGPGAPLWLNLEPQPGAEIILRGLDRDGELASFSVAAGGEFSIEIRRKAGASP